MTIFEKIIARQIPAEIVLENEKVLAFKDVNPQAPVHLLVIPEHHIDTGRCEPERSGTAR